MGSVHGRLIPKTLPFHAIRIVAACRVKAILQTCKESLRGNGLRLRSSSYGGKPIGCDWQKSRETT